MRAPRSSISFSAACAHRLLFSSAACCSRNWTTSAPRPARLRIVKTIRRGHDELAALRQHAPRLREKFAPVLQVLNHLEGDYQVESGVAVWQSRARSLLKPQIGPGKVGPSVFHGVG